MSDPVAEYERAVADRLGTGEAVAFGYGRHALAAILRALGGAEGDEVVLSPLNCKVVPLAVLSVGCVPVYAELRPGALNLDAETVSAALTPRTRAVVFQYTYGVSTGAAEVADLGRERGVPVIEDCAQSLPAPSEGETPGAYGDVSLFSLNLRKPLPAGSGGLAVARDADLAERVRTLRDALPRRGLAAEAALRLETAVHRWILRPRNYWTFFGLAQRFRSTYEQRSRAEEIADVIEASALRPSPFQAREGLRWMRRLDASLANRRACFAHYTAALQEVPGVEIPRGLRPQALYYFPVFVEEKRALIEEARRRSVELLAWPGATPIFPLERPADLATYGYEAGGRPHAEEVARRLVGLPMDTHTGPSERAALVDLVRAHAETHD